MGGNHSTPEQNKHGRHVLVSRADAASIGRNGPLRGGVISPAAIELAQSYRRHNKQLAALLDMRQHHGYQPRSIVGAVVDQAIIEQLRRMDSSDVAIGSVSSAVNTDIIQHPLRRPLR